MSDELLNKWSRKVEDALDRYRTERFRGESFEEASLPYRFELSGWIQWFTEFRKNGRTVACTFCEDTTSRIAARLGDADKLDFREVEWNVHDVDATAQAVWEFLMTSRLKSEQ